MYRVGGIVAAIALALALAPSALADFPFTAPHSPAGYAGYHSSQPPNDIDGDSSTWKFAATPEPASPWLLNARELNGVRGGHVVDANQAQKTAWQTTTGRPDVSIAVLDSGIKWNDAEAMQELRFKLRLNARELPKPRIGGPALIPGVNCSSYRRADDANRDGVFDLRDFACDSRVNTTDSRRAGPKGYLTPQDLLIAFSNRADSDHNGFVDDIAGWDFMDNDNDPFDDVQYGHGTGEAKDSSAEADNKVGQPGACPNCTFIPLRVGDSFVADVNRFAQATLYAVDRGVFVVQEALGTLNNSALARRAVNYAYRHGTAIIASAADEAAQHHNWPSTYAKTIVVNSVTQYDDSTTNNKSYLQFNGCTNFSTHITLAIPSTSCSSNATGVGAGMAGLVYSAALNAHKAGVLQRSNGRCRRPSGGRCLITPNEVRQLMASGELSPMVTGASSPDTTGLADDVDFLGAGTACTPVPLPGCTDPNRNFPQAEAFRPIPGPSGTVTRSYPARAGFDEFYGYGRVNMRKAVGATFAAKIPPEAEITSPAWYRMLDPASRSVAVRGEMWARGHSYKCTVEVAPGSEPNNDTDFKQVPSPVCNGSARTGAFSGVLASLDVAALKGRFPPGTDFNGSAPPPQSNNVADGGTHQNNRPNQEPFGFTVRLRVTSVQGPSTLTGQDRRNLYLHRDADLVRGWPKLLRSDGASSPALVDLDGDNRNEVVFGTSDGTVHALRRDGREVRGWPVRVDRLPLHTGEHAFARGGVSRELSHGAILSSPAVGDIDRDGAPEVVVADFEGKVYVWGAGGRLRWKHAARRAYSGKPLRRFRNVRRGKRYRTQHGFIASPVLANLDASRDGRLDVIAAGMDRHVYAWRSSGRRVGGFPVLVVDRDKISAVDPTTHAPTFRAGIGDELNQGAIVDTPAVGDLNGDRKPEIVVGTNEEYPAADDGGLNSGATTPSGPLLDLLHDQVGLDTGNTRLFALKPTGDPGAVSLSNSIFLWRFKVGVLLTELLPVVGEGVTGAPVIGNANCGGDSTHPKVGVIPDAGLAYLLRANGTSCYGQAAGHDNALQTEFAAGAGKYDSPTLAAVGHPAFGRIDATGGPAFLAPVAGILRALDAAVNEYQGGQDMIAAWSPETGGLRPGYPSPVNDLQFLTGPSTADVDGLPGEEVLGGTASLDLNALSGAGAPLPGWPKFTGDWMVTNPAIGSFGVDETAKGAHRSVIAATRSGSFFAYDTNAPACAPASWPRFHHDNANSGVLERDAVSPGKPTVVKVTGSAISFRAPGDDLRCGKVKAYQAVTSSRRIKRNLAGAKAIPAPVPGEPGATQTLAIPASAGRYVALRAVDDQGNVGRALRLDRVGGCRDRTRPHTVVTRRGIRARRHRLLARGRSRDGGCKGRNGRVKRVRVAIARLRGHRCQFVTRRGRLTHRRSCRRPVTLRPHRGRRRWTLRIRHARLKRGRYRLTARAVDRAGNVERVGRRNRVRFRIR